MMTRIMRITTVILRTTSMAEKPALKMVRILLVKVVLKKSRG